MPIRRITSERTAFDRNKYVYISISAKSLLFKNSYYLGLSFCMWSNEKLAFTVD